MEKVTEACEKYKVWQCISLSLRKKAALWTVVIVQAALHMSQSLGTFWNVVRVIYN